MPKEARARIKINKLLEAAGWCFFDSPQGKAISHLISEDASTLAKYLDRARDSGLASTKVVLLREGFDAAWFENGQTRLVP